jgi:hypothetical protein
MTRRVRVTIGRVTVEGGAISNPAAYRAELERQVALSLGAVGALQRVAGGHMAAFDAGPVKAAGDPKAIAGVIAGAIGGRRKP